MELRGDDGPGMRALRDALGNAMRHHLIGAVLFRGVHGHDGDLEGFQGIVDFGRGHLRAFVLLHVEHLLPQAFEKQHCCGGLE